jgi:hypothetical protein
MVHRMSERSERNVTAQRPPRSGGRLTGATLPGVDFGLAATWMVHQ